MFWCNIAKQHHSTVCVVQIVVGAQVATSVTKEVIDADADFYVKSGKWRQDHGLDRPNLLGSLSGLKPARPYQSLVLCLTPFLQSTQRVPMILLSALLNWICSPQSVPCFVPPNRLSHVLHLNLLQSL